MKRKVKKKTKKKSKKERARSGGGGAENNNFKFTELEYDNFQGVTLESQELQKIFQRLFFIVNYLKMRKIMDLYW